jgi:hypothetical protein
MSGWQPYSWQEIRDGTIARVRLETGRVYRCRLGFRGRVGAWWPIEGNRKRPIGTLEPVAILIEAAGMVAPEDWQRSAQMQTGAM